MTRASPTNAVNTCSGCVGITRTYATVTNAGIVFFAAALLAARCADAQDPIPRFELTPFAGYALGGKFKDMTTGETVVLDDGDGFGLILNIRESANTQWEILYSRLSTQADTSTLPIGSPSLDLDVHYIQGGGTYIGAGEHARPFLAATIGAAHFDPGLTGLDDETFFAFSIGAGLQLRPNDRLGMRLELRAYGTLLRSDTDLFCQSGPTANTCAIRSEGTVLWQFQPLLGIVFRF